ncbi:polymer-forming cytoskeletal protein [Hephaestia sp. GCM10023244]|uniref:bactofilin family protein n=1 Tax=unclassified Hephaestia TaxID=2631281 RepID=UPI0020778C4D|nr:polymer-forming cytoskeletal protein [Hephaestia sp. MAHUQ-44]MCM8730845.1 polymer-forming cytoskeletal protein [Hephaestia sp. MAHUQ-44]
MFGKKDVGSAAAKRNGFSVLGPDVTVTGDIEADSDLHIDGIVAGDLVCASLIQTADSRITGAVRAQSARIGGTIEGSVTVDALTIEASARISGDIAYKTVTIEGGATVDGRLSRIDGNDDTASGPVRLITAAE